MPGDHKDNPPNPYPEPRQKEPSELGEKVDWMTYTHQELYNMVHTGVDLTSAASVKDNWTTLGTTLAEVKDQLISAIYASSSGWEGESAEKARDGLLTVVKWAENTSDHATNVAECINLEIEHVVTAREQMPKPAPVSTPVPPVDQVVAPTTTPVSPSNRFATDALIPVDSPVLWQPAAKSPFTGIDQVGAPVVTEIAAADAGHRAAADVMAAFQQGSFAVDQTVPAFSPPVNPVAPPVVPVPNVDLGASPAPRVDGSPVVLGSNPTTGAPVAGRTSTSGGGGGYSGGGGGGYAPAARGDYSGGDYSGGGYSGSGQSSGGGGGASPSPIGPGGSSGVIGGADSRAAAAQTSNFQPSKGVGGAGVPGGMMGAPMGGAPMAGRDEEHDRQRAQYLEEDDNLFGIDKKAAPPVIGT